MKAASSQREHYNTTAKKPIGESDTSVGSAICGGDGGHRSPYVPSPSDCTCSTEKAPSCGPVALQGVLPGLIPDTQSPDWWAGAAPSSGRPVAVVVPRNPRPVVEPTPGGSTCLDLIETSEQSGGGRRVAWGPLRRDSLRVVGALHAAQETGRAVRMESCSREWMAYRHVPSKSVVLRSNRCRDRFCLVCMALRSQVMVRRFEEVVAGWPVVRMMTFTVRSQVSLKKQIVYLRGCFKELRRRRGWKEHVTGYLVTLEVTHSERGWHAHLHVLADGKYWAFEELKKEWKGITAGEGSVDIRRSGSVKEALKYVIKPKVLMGMSEEVMRELIETMRGVRCLSTGGSLRGVVTEEELDSDEAMGLREEYEPIGRLDVIVERYRAGDRSADVVDTIKTAVKLGILQKEKG